MPDHIPLRELIVKFVRQVTIGREVFSQVHPLLTLLLHLPRSRLGVTILLGHALRAITRSLALALALALPDRLEDRNIRLPILLLQL